METETILLRVVDVMDGSKEAFRWMALDDFLSRIRINKLSDGQFLVGTILPPVRNRKLQGPE